VAMGVSRPDPVRLCPRLAHGGGHAEGIQVGEPRGMASRRPTHPYPRRALPRPAGK
jgi:hypothetical protein